MDGVIGRFSAVPREKKSGAGNSGFQGVLNVSMGYTRVSPIALICRPPRKFGASFSGLEVYLMYWTVFLYENLDKLLKTNK